MYLYLTITKPNISYAVSLVSQFVKLHGFRMRSCYLHCSVFEESPRSCDTIYKPNGHFRIKGFTYANLVSSPSNRQSTTGYCTYFGDNLVTRKSKKKKMVVQSSVEVEYRAMAHNPSELTWLQHFL